MRYTTAVDVRRVPRGVRTNLRWVGVLTIVIASALCARFAKLDAANKGSKGSTGTAPVLVNPGGQADALTSEYGYAAAVLASNPIGYWRLEDYSGSSVADWSSASHGGAIAGTVTKAQGGALADGSVAMRFTGDSNTRIDIDDSAFQLTNAVTVEAWAKIDDAQAAGSIFEKSVGTTAAFRLAQEAGAWTWRVSGTFGSLQRWMAVAPEDGREVEGWHTLHW